MRLLRTSVLVLLTGGLGLPLSGGEAVQASWERLKSLVGEWEGSYGGKPARVSYRLVSGGTALMETLEAPDGSRMVSVYHPDGASLLMTHFCSAGNQPRMRSSGLVSGTLDFSFVDVTNLKSAEALRMTRLVVSFPDADRLVQEWTSKAGTKEEVGRFEFARMK